jgi:hypothetical protein
MLTRCKDADARETLVLAIRHRRIALRGHDEVFSSGLILLLAF